MDHERWTKALGTFVQPGVTLGLAALLLLDVTFGRRVLHAHEYAIAAAIVVVGAVVLRGAHPAAAALVAAGSSIAVTVVVDGSQMTVWSRFIDAGAWPSLAEVAGLAAVAGFAARSSSPPLAIGAAAVVVVALGMAAWVRYDGPFSGVLGGLLLGSAACSIGIGLYLRLLEEARRRDAGRARQDERLAIARELHDVVAHHVTGIVVQAQAARLVSHSRPDAVDQALADIESAGAQAMVAMRHLVGSLRSEGEQAPLSPAAAISDLRDLVRTTIASGLPVELMVDLDDEVLPADLAVSVHRIVQESLTNARRHAVDPSFVSVHIRRVRDDVRITVVDDGRPTARRDGGFGLAGMTERAAALGGRLVAGPGRDGGWVVAAALPLSSVEITAC